MSGIIAQRDHVKQLGFSSSERNELLRLSEEDRLEEVYTIIINRMNEYELSLEGNDFYCGLLEQKLSFNAVTCLLKNDLTDRIDILNSLANKLVRLFLKALVSSCVESGVVELDAKDVLVKIGSFRRPEART